MQELLEEIGEKMAFFWENAFNYFDKKAEICAVFSSGTAAKEERISLYGYDRNYRIVANATNEKEHSERRVDGRTSKMQHDVLAERSKRKTGHLEMLTGKGNADDGDEQENAEKDVHQPGPQTTENNPKDVQRDADATRGRLRVLHLCTERPQTEQTDLEGLQGYGNADNRDGHCQTSGKITYGSFETTEEPPQKIA